jgi:hypothetical protein
MSLPKMTSNLTMHCLKDSMVHPVFSHAFELGR